MKRLTRHGVGGTTTIECYTTINSVQIIHQASVFKRPKRLVSFDIEYVWDLLKDSLSTMKVSRKNNPGLWRRKQEAIEAKKYMLNQGGK